jgi:hypothetical protein
VSVLVLVGRSPTIWSLPRGDEAEHSAPAPAEGRGGFDQRSDGAVGRPVVPTARARSGRPHGSDGAEAPRVSDGRHQRCSHPSLEDAPRPMLLFPIDVLGIAQQQVARHLLTAACAGNGLRAGALNLEHISRDCDASRPGAAAA